MPARGAKARKGHLRGGIDETVLDSPARYEPGQGWHSGLSYRFRQIATPSRRGTMTGKSLGELYIRRLNC